MLLIRSLRHRPFFFHDPGAGIRPHRQSGCRVVFLQIPLQFGASNCTIANL